MAAPHVSGVLALMLEADPTLTPKRAKEILRDSSREDEFTGSVPNSSWGYGKIDAQAAVLQTVSSAQHKGSGCAQVYDLDATMALLIGILFVITRRTFYR